MTDTPKRPAKRPRKAGRPVTLRDIAERAGFSTATVSVILGDGPKAAMYSEKTRKLVWTLAREMGYTPNLVARSLKSGRSRMIGVIMSSQHSAYYGRPLRAAEVAAAAAGYEIITADMQYDFSRFERCIRWMASWNVEGLILMTGGRLVNTSMVSLLRETGVPYIKGGVRHPDDPCSTIVFDNYDAARMMARHLFGLGHRRVAMLTAHPANAVSEERVRGVLAAAREMGLPEHTVRVIAPEEAHIGLAAGHRMTAGLLREKTRPTALLLHSDRMAVGALRCLHETGLRVPEDISVAGFDDMLLDSAAPDEERVGAFLWPALTTVRTPLDQIGAECVRLLLEMVQNPALCETPRTIVFPPTLVVRESTGPAPDTA